MCILKPSCSFSGFSNTKEPESYQYKIKDISEFAT